MRRCACSGWNNGARRALQWQFVSGIRVQPAGAASGVAGLSGSRNTFRVVRASAMENGRRRIGDAAGAADDAMM
jgi:hypothetical protein